MATLDEHRERLTKNTAYLTVAFVGQKILSTLTYFVYANLLGPGTTGAYLFVISVANVFGILVDAGLSPILIREVAREPQRARSLFRTMVRFKLYSGAVTLLIIAASAPLFIHDLVRAQFLIFAAVYVVLESFSLSAYGVLRGLQRLRYEAIGSSLAQLVPLTIAAAGLLLTRNPLWLGVALLASGVTNVLYSTWQVRRLTASLPRGETAFPWTAKTVSPFFLSGVLQRIYGYIDVVLMGLLVSGHFVGLYGTAYRITYATQFLPIAFNTSLYPALSQAFHDSQETLQALVERSFRVLVGLGSAVAVVLGILARPLLTLFFPDYIDAALALQISVASAPMLFLNFLYSSLLNATNRQTRNTISLAVVAATSIGTNLLMIPLWQHVGASIAALISTTVFTLVMAYFARSFLGWSRATTMFLVRLIVVVMVVLVFGWWLATAVSVLLALPILGISFITALILGRVFSWPEMASVLRQFRRSR